MEQLKQNNESLKKAHEVLMSGGIVIFPTETVYGIGTLASNEKGVKRIYEIKKRSSDKPLQVLIADLKQIESLALEITPKARELMKKHWPGPLTLVFKAKSGGSVGIRMPKHDWLLKLIKETGPLAATSANLSGETEPISAQEVKIEADLLIDGGKCKLGEASTVIDVSVDPPLILREGRIKI
ncbi:MAG: L-threonylcarbamoyladenylate synthase [Candidatus Margulisiibacteriota bacterium]